eukprot:1610401-Prymnesium_polylepis.1
MGVGGLTLTGALTPSLQPDPKPTTPPPLGPGGNMGPKKNESESVHFTPRPDPQPLFPQSKAEAERIAKVREQMGASLTSMHSDVFKPQEQHKYKASGAKVRSRRTRVLGRRLRGAQTQLVATWTQLAGARSPCGAKTRCQPLRSLCAGWLPVGR